MGDERTGFEPSAPAPRGRMRAVVALWVASAAPVLLLARGPDSAEAADPVQDSCTACHADSAFLVTNKKLYDYYRQWDVSIHKQEGVTCDDCHGGRPDAPDKETAHDGGVGASDPTSGVYFKNVIETCGDCHDEILEGFRTSEHFAHLEKKDDKQGPTCVTCHGSINVEVLNVNSVEAACARCHNEETKNEPELPAKARSVLNRFLSIHRFYRYIGVHAAPDEAQAFFSEFDPRMERLAVTWHTFDLEKIDAGTFEALGVLKAKRDELRGRRTPPQAPPEVAPTP